MQNMILKRTCPWIRSLVVTLFLLMAVAADASPTGTRLSLQEAETRALDRSPRLKGADFDVNAAREQAEAQAATLYPRLSLDANFRYVTEVPEIRTGPVRLPFGDNESYSLGPTVSYTLWDQGARRSGSESLGLLTAAREQEKQASANQVLLATRLSYVQAQLASQELRYVIQSLELARSQSRDIERRYRAGAVSRVDWLTSQLEISSFEMRLAQGQSEQEASLADLSSYVGEIEGKDHLTLDPLEDSAAMIQIAQLNPPGSGHPQLKAQEQVAESFERAAEGQGASLWPAVQLQAKYTLDYPNGPNLEQVQQNTVAVGLFWTLFDWDRTRSLVAQKKAEAEAARYRREQTALDLRRDWQKASIRLESLSRQGQTVERAVRQAEEIARLKYESYRAGKISFFEVQSANLRLLESRVQKARLEAQRLLQYHTLQFIEGVGQKTGAMKELGK